MGSIDCSLLADGPSDRALLPILQWVVQEHAGDAVVQCEWADLRRIRQPPRTLEQRIRRAVDLYPCDVLFVHRDAETRDPERRYEEIRSAIDQARSHGFTIPHICVVPVRMQEAWLLLDEMAIRQAADNPNGSVPIQLPRATHVETIPDPKDTLYSLLRTASEFRGTRLKKFRPETRAPLVANYMNDFQCLRELPAFQRLENDVRQIIEAIAN
jgi:hypothetical protein